MYKYFKVVKNDKEILIMTLLIMTILITFNTGDI
jgi:hypothetical protein